MFQITLSEPTATLRWGKGGYKLFLQLVAKTNLSDLSVPPFNVTDCSRLQSGTLSGRRGDFFMLENGIYSKKTSPYCQLNIYRR